MKGGIEMGIKPLFLALFQQNWMANYGAISS